MYTRNLLWLVSLVSAAPLYAADVPANTPLAPQQVFRYNNHSDPGTLDPQKVEENTAAQIVLDLFEGLVWMDGEGRCSPLRLNAGRYWTAASAIFSICVAVCSGPTVSL
ncbi:binding protein [Escherichia coli]|uniref:Binding protein n=1 Tax=Escherichia coli TaxID=562 RepID=A0A376ZJ45_ECOLX|nr:binding protein [Escherichia coli]